MAAFVPEGMVPRPDIPYAALNRVVSPGYFESMRIPVLRGRLFDERDGPDAPLVTIVNDTMARKYWPNEDALGKRIGVVLEGRGRVWIEIVVVVSNVRQMGLDVLPKEEMYFPYWQANGNYMMARALVIRTTTDPMSLLSAVRLAVWSIDPDQALSEVMTMDDILDREVEQRRNQASLLGGLSTLALTLACVGMYGVMAYLVAQQHHEFGVRTALGARPRDILRLVMQRGVKLTAAGVGIGIGSGFVITTIMRSLLFGVSPFDLVTFAGAVFLLTA